MKVDLNRRCTPCRWFFAKGRVREDGRLLHDFFLAEVKAPSEYAAPWDYYKIRRIMSAQEVSVYDCVSFGMRLSRANPTYVCPP